MTFLKQFEMQTTNSEMKYAHDLKVSNFSICMIQRCLCAFPDNCGMENLSVIIEKIQIDEIND